MTTRPVVIGAGPNGLVCATLLARAGLRPIVIEARDHPGGAATTREIAPGFRVPAFAHSVAMRPDVVSAIGLVARGVRVMYPRIAAAVHTDDGRLLAMPADVDHGAEALKRFSARDAERWPEFCATAMAIVSVVTRLLESVPPSIDSPSGRDLWTLVRAGRLARRLGRARFYELLRWGPMPIADLAAEWFETPALAALLCSRGVLGMHAGPRSAGTAAQWLLQSAIEGHPLGLPGMTAAGPGALSDTLAQAAVEAGAEIRCGSAVARIEVDERGAHAVTLRDGTTIETSTIVSAVDPRRTFLDLIDPVWLAPSFRQQLRNYRCRGVLAKVNLALSAMPRWTGLDGAPEDALSGRLIVGGTPDDIERAFDSVKYGQMSPRPWLEVTMPSILDPALAPAGAHVMSVYVQWAPYDLREGSWDDRRDELTATVIRRLAEVAPDLPSLVVAAETLTPRDLERQLGLTGGQIFHGEHALDQLYAMRPVLGWAQHRTPITGLYLCGSGTHPGGGVTGASGVHAAQVVLRDTGRRRTRDQD